MSSEYGTEGGRDGGREGRREGDGGVGRDGLVSRAGREVCY